MKEVHFQPILLKEHTIVSREKIVKLLSIDSWALPLKALNSIYKMVAYKNNSFPAKLFLSIPFIFMFIFILTGTAQGINIYSCGTLGTDGGYYNLTQDITANPGQDCLDITASNVTFNGNYHTITVNSTSYTAFGIKVQSLPVGANYPTLINENFYNFKMVDDDRSTAANRGLGLSMVNDSRFSNFQAINFKNFDGVDAEYLKNVTFTDFSVSNSLWGMVPENLDNVTFSNFHVDENILDGFNVGRMTNSHISNFTANYNGRSGGRIAWSTNSTILNGDISYNRYSGGNEFNPPGNYGDITLYQNTGPIIFSYINLSGIYKRVYFNQISDIFEIQNNGIDWQTNISSGGNTLDRQVFSWEQDNLTWNDGNATGEITAYYSFSNLYPLRNYTVSDNGTLLYTLTTDSSGNIPQFSIALSGGIDQISVIATSGNNITPLINTITSPSNGSTVSGIINVTDSVSENVSITNVELYRNGTLVDTKKSSPFTFIWNTTQVANGLYTLQSKAYDAANNVGVSSLVTVTVSNVPGQLATITVSPSSATLLSGQNQQFTATGYDAYGNLVPITPIWSSSSGTISSSGLFTAQAAGKAIITATVDSLNDTAVVTVIPVVSITSPLDGVSVLRKSTVTITANASDNIGVARVEFYVNGVLKCTDTTVPYTCDWFVPAKRGVTYSLQAQTYDDKGNAGSPAIVEVTSI